MSHLSDTVGSMNETNHNEITPKVRKDILPNPWSDVLQDHTRYVLDHLPISSFLRDGHCILKSLDRKFGKISIEDAIAYNYKIKNIDTDEILESFDTLDELIDAGWVVD